ncbi:MAG: 50S ribosomal protein L32 [Candidatus Omnitrophota bacterium]|nr:50S ribosomal protein L32 [Candidatus Omnitrophota bacterium]MDZ4241837.1 50S ribosomal protein L32 [Candidatus Omnitrophota bacterium]
MANPKRQHSKQRSRKRRTHWKIRLSGVGPCSNCKSLIVPHRVCPFCGFYKGKQIVAVKAKEEKAQA